MGNLIDIKQERNKVINHNLFNHNLIMLLNGFSAHIAYH
jgi:hypothetical protein